MGFISDSNKTDEFDRTEVVIGDSQDSSLKAKVDSEGNQFVSVKFQENSILDAWSRLRVSLPTTSFELNFNFSDRPLTMNTEVVSGGTSVYSYNKSGIEMTVPSTNGASVIRQTKRYFKYVTGKGTTCLTAVACNSGKSGLVQEWGMFDINDGWFFRYSNTSLSAVIRSSTSGSPIETVINQADWNIDKLDGTGPSGITVDPTKYNVWLLDFAWQGAGGVRFGLFFNGSVVYCHEFQPSNTLTVPFTRTPVLPIRYQISNIQTTSGSSTMLHGTLGLVIDNSGNLIEPALQFSASREASGLNVDTTLVPIITIRPKLLFNSNVNRVPIEITNVNISTESQIVYYQILKNVSLTGSSFISASSNSCIEYDVSATSFSGGEKLSEGYVLASSQGNTRNLASAEAFLNKLNFLSLNVAGNSQENISVVCRTVTSTSLTFVDIVWEEFQ